MVSAEPTAHCQQTVHHPAVQQGSLSRQQVAAGCMLVCRTVPCRWIAFAQPALQSCRHCGTGTGFALADQYECFFMPTQMALGERKAA